MIDELVAQPQDDSQATFAPIMNKEDGSIEWNLPAREIVNRVRGFQPFPTSYTKYQDKKLTIWRSQSLEVGSQISEAGMILEAKGESLIVGCGKQTALRIIELQLEGKRRMSARDFLNGVKINVGEKLG